MSRQTGWFTARLASRLNHRRLVPVALLCCTWLVFSQVFIAKFVSWDDPDLVYANPALNPPTLAKTAEFWIKPTEKLYTPLAYTLWSVVAAWQHRATGVLLSPASFHILNLILHTAATFFVYLLLKELLDGTRSAAFFGALLFAIHPLQVEPVAWVSGMNNVLCGALGLAALWQYVLYAKASDRASRHFIFATIFFALALLSKPTAVVIPLLAAAIDLWAIQRKPRRVLAPLCIWLAMAVPIALIARLAQPIKGLLAPPITTRILVAVDAIGFYVTKLFAPFNLTIDYERKPQFIADQFWLCWPGVLVLLITGVVWLKTRSGTLRAAMLIVPLALLPVLGLTPFDFQDYSTVADRYMYLPMFGVALFAGCIFNRGRRHQLVQWSLAAILLMLLAGRSADYLRYWHDTLTLTGRQLAYDSGSSTGHKIRAAYLASVGQDKSAESEYDLAIEAIQREGRTGDGAVWVDYGNLLLRQGRYADSLPQYQEGLARLGSAHVAAAYNNWGIALVNVGDAAAARDKFLQALSAEPANADAKKNLARLDSIAKP